MPEQKRRIRISSLLIFLAAVVLHGCSAKQPVVTYHESPARKPSEAPVKSRINPEKRPAPADVTTKKRPIIQPMSKPVVQDIDPVTEETPAGNILAILTQVDDRIAAYEKKQQAWNRVRMEGASLVLEGETENAMDSCEAKLTSILERYNKLHRDLIGRVDGLSDSGNIPGSYFTVWQEDVSYLESNCNSLSGDVEQTEGLIAGSLKTMMQEKERELQEMMASGAYDEVIDLYEKFPRDREPLPSFEATAAYARALLKSGREDDAATVLKEQLISLQKGNQLEQEFSLMQLIADLQFGAGAYENAFDRYQDIINRYAGLGEKIDRAHTQQALISERSSRGVEIRSYADIMRRSLTYNPGRDGFSLYLTALKFQDSFPESSLLPAVNQIMFDGLEQAENWFTGIWRNLLMLQAEKKYHEAINIIARLPMPNMAEDKVQMLTSLRDQLVAASLKEEEERRQAHEEVLKNTWSQGEELLAGKEYDRAIEVFVSLAETPFAQQADGKIVEASRLAAQEGRRRAAELFVQAGKAGDPEQRVSLLFESRRLLRDIMEKYPRSGLVEKAGKNLQRIEREINNIDPALLEAAERKETGGQVSPDTLGGSLNGITFPGSETGEVPSPRQSEHTGESR